MEFRGCRVSTEGWGLGWQWGQAPADVEDRAQSLSPTKKRRKVNDSVEAKIDTVDPG